VALLPTLVEAALGLAIVFLVVSLLIAGLQELVATLLGWRSRHLQRSLGQMMRNQAAEARGIDGAEEGAAVHALVARLYGHDLLQSLSHRSEIPLAQVRRRLGRGLAGLLARLPGCPAVADHPPAGALPANLAHIEPDTFAAVLVQELLPDLARRPASGRADLVEVRRDLAAAAGIPRAFRATLLSLADQAQVRPRLDPLEAFQREIAALFERSMQRASGVYKRHVQGFCFLAGLLAAIALNLNSLQLAQALHRSNSLREPLANSAAEIVRARSVAAAAPAGLPASASGLSPDQETLVRLLSEDLPIEPLVLLSPTPTFAASLSAPDSLPPCRGGRSGGSGACPARRGLRLDGARLLQAIPGWLVSALAISMGAPFWFEVLARLVNVRAISRGGQPRGGLGPL
jgi:hypothetical protein